MKKFVLIILLFVSLQAKAQEDCILKLDKDSIRVFSCAGSSKFRSVKTTFEVNSRLSQLAAMVFDIESYKAWQYKTLSARIVKKINEGEIIYYTEVESPAPVSNRDFVIQLSILQNPETRELTIEAVSIPNYLPEVKDVIRTPYSRARWSVRPLSKNKLQVEYYIEIDLGGSIPPWLVNLVAHQAPYQTFKDMKKNIWKYENQKIPFIKD